MNTSTPASTLKFVARARQWTPSPSYLAAVAYAETFTPTWEGFLSDEWRASQLRDLASMVEDIDQPGSKKLAFLYREAAKRVEDNDYDGVAQLTQFMQGVGETARRGALSAVQGTKMLGPIFLAVAILYAFGRR